MNSRDGFELKMQLPDIFFPPELLLRFMCTFKVNKILKKHKTY